MNQSVPTVRPAAGVSINGGAPISGVVERLPGLLAFLTLEEKVLVLTGHEYWATWPLARIGLRRMLLSDGPSGVRGELWDERSPSLNLPSATALGSSWDLDIARRYGNVAAVEARRKGVDVVMGPTINLHRPPSITSPTISRPSGSWWMFRSTSGPCASCTCWPSKKPSPNRVPGW